MHNHKFAEYTLINPIITAFNHDSHAYSNGGLMENTMQLAYETVKYATGFVNDVTPRGFTDIHYDVETSDLSNTNTGTEAFINGQTVSVAGQEAKDLFQGNVIGVIKDAEIVYNETRLNTGNVLTDTLSIFANNLLSGKKSTSNILVPVTGLVENVASKYVGSITDGIVKSISGADIGVISSQGKSIQTNNNTAATNTNLNVGYGKKIPNTNGTVSHPNNISDALTTFRNLVGSKK